VRCTRSRSSVIVLRAPWAGHHRRCTVDQCTSYSPSMSTLVDVCIGLSAPRHAHALSADRDTGRAHSRRDVHAPSSHSNSDNARYGSVLRSRRPALCGSVISISRPPLGRASRFACCPTRTLVLVCSDLTGPGPGQVQVQVRLSLALPCRLMPPGGRQSPRYRSRSLQALNRISERAEIDIWSSSRSPSGSRDSI